MSKLTTVNQFIEDNNLNSRVQLSGQGVFSTDLDLFDDVVLKPLNIERKTFDELTENTVLFNAALTKVGGTLATDYFTANADISELALNYNHGAMSQHVHTSVYTRKHGENDANIITSITVNDPNGYFNEVQSELIKVFNDLDN